MDVTLKDIRIYQREIIWEENEELCKIMFPNADFRISIPVKHLYEVLSRSEKIVIRHRHWDEELDTIKTYYNVEGSNLTLKYVIKQLLLQGLSYPHHFLEDFTKIDEGDNVFDIDFGF